LCAGSVCESKLLCSSSVRGVSLGFAGAVPAAFGIGQLFEVSWLAARRRVERVTSHGHNSNFVSLVSVAAEVMMVKRPTLERAGEQSTRVLLRRGLAFASVMLPVSTVSGFFPFQMTKWNQASAGASQLANVLLLRMDSDP